MTNDSFELVELGNAELAIEAIIGGDDEELDSKFPTAVAPYVEFDE